MTHLQGSSFGDFRCMLLLAMLASACTPVAPVVTVRGDAPASDKVQTTLPEGGLKRDQMRLLGAEPTGPPLLERGNMQAKGRNQTMPATLHYTSNPDECPAGMTVGYGDERFHGVDRQTFSSTGYGAPPPNYYSPQQKRLLAMRAAQLDALRNLTEQIYGMHVTTTTTVGDMVVVNDRARVMIDRYIKGAQVVMGNPLADGTYEMTMQLTVVQPVLQALRAEAIRPRCVSIETLVNTGQR
ncbi:MAG: LPP20 family lipoprotein [Pseudomonadota bacterium]|mgnify:CR=1 FL=1